MLWPPAISESSQRPVSGTSEAGASWPGGTEFPQQIQKKKQGHSCTRGHFEAISQGVGGQCCCACEATVWWHLQEG